MATISKTLLSALKAVENGDWKKVILLSNTLKKSDKVLCYSARETNTSTLSQNPSAFPLVMGLYDYNEKGDADEAAEMFTTVLLNEATNPIALFYLVFLFSFSPLLFLLFFIYFHIVNMYLNICFCNYVQLYMFQKH